MTLSRVNGQKISFISDLRKIYLNAAIELDDNYTANFHSMSTCLNLLRPRPRPRFKLAISSVSASRFNFSSSYLRNSGKELAGDAQKRHDGLSISNATLYPRLIPSNNVISPQDFLKRYESLDPNQIVDGELVTIRGTLERLASIFFSAHAFRKDKFYP